MTDGTQGMSQGIDTPISQPVSTPPAQSASQAPSQVAEERTFRQSEVSDIVKRAKYGAVEDYKRMMSERPDYAQQKYGDATQYQQTDARNNQPSQGSHESELRRIAAEEAQRLRDQWINEATQKSQDEQAQRMVQDFWSKVLPGREKYQDFDQVTGDIDFARFPNVVQLLAGYMDNSDAVLYELGKDRIKMANLEQLAMMSPKDAIVQAQRLAQSLKDNDNASKVRMPNEPLSQMRPSNTGTDNGAMSVKDYRRKYRV